MAYIYKMTNKINGKIYIGKTKKSISERIAQHINDSKREKNKNRPIYIAIKEYGIDNFSIEEIEEVPEEKADERERYWIEYYRSFKFGYNSTFGGSGKNYIDYDLVAETYKNVHCISKTAELCNCHVDSVRNVLNQKNIEIDKIYPIKLISKIVNMYDKNGNYIQTFSSTREASRFLIKKYNLNPESESGYSSHISECCKGKRKTCYGFIWRFA